MNIYAIQCVKINSSSFLAYCDMLDFATECHYYQYVDKKNFPNWNPWNLQILNSVDQTNNAAHTYLSIIALCIIKWPWQLLIALSISEV
jgi:hypothetical protein